MSLKQFYLFMSQAAELFSLFLPFLFCELFVKKAILFPVQTKAADAVLARRAVLHSDAFFTIATVHESDTSVTAFRCNSSVTFFT